MLNNSHSLTQRNAVSQTLMLKVKREKNGGN